MKTRTPEEAREQLSRERNVRRKIYDESAQEYVACYSCGSLMTTFENICPACGTLTCRRRKI